jgi:signal transduction histidine kinase
MLSYDQDSAGKKYMTVEALEQIAETCPLPVYGLYSTLLGHGIVGGRLVSAESQGRLAGELAIRVLNGERPEEIAIVGLDGGTDMFDARQLARWNFDEADLPPESIVVYREPTAWEQFGNYFLIGVAGFLLLISIIVSLLVNRTRRMKAEQEARDLAGKILTVQEDERRYLAREIHDDLSQRLAASAIVAGNLQQKLHQTPEVREELGRLGGNLITICDDMHRLSRQMSPAILDDFGLSDALRAECDRVADRDGIEAVFRSGDVPPEVPHDIELGLYRIAQEALWNTSKHAKADRVAVDLLADPEFICLEIRDDGCGFDPGLVTAKQGLGLASMRERARLLGGTIVIDAAPGAGVQISVRIPLSEPCA